jgi:hypothetical protein
MSDVLDLAKRLIAAPSITPATGAVFDELEAMLTPLGFAVHRFTRGEGPKAATRHRSKTCWRSGPAPKVRATSLLPVISTWCPRARAGRATPSNRKCAANCFTGAARST